MRMLLKSMGRLLSELVGLSMVAPSVASASVVVDSARAVDSQATTRHRTGPNGVVRADLSPHRRQPVSWRAVRASPTPRCRLVVDTTTIVTEARDSRSRIRVTRRAESGVPPGIADSQSRNRRFWRHLPTPRPDSETDSLETRPGATASSGRSGASRAPGRRGVRRSRTPLRGRGAAWFRRASPSRSPRSVALS